MTPYTAMLRPLVIFLSLLFATPSTQAQNVDEFVPSNLLWFFYHEMGHALIDIYEMPIFGQEEDAADVLSVLMVNEFFEEELSRQIINNAAYAFISFSEMNEDDDNAIYADVHGPDLQRLYTMACLFIGGNFEERKELADLYEIPDDRLEGCEEEFNLAYSSWWSVMDEAAVEGGGETVVFLGKSSKDDPIKQAMFEIFDEELKELNKYYAFEHDIKVDIEDCDEPNAFYLPDERTIIMCTEMATLLGEMLE